MVLVTGPAGAGKTTTLYALIRQVSGRFPERSIITVEDPVEQRIDRVTQIQINPHGELNYQVCMRSLLRQDPQVILIGEIRDAPTAAVAVDAALTGHLILTTMHSGAPAEACTIVLSADRYCRRPATELPSSYGTALRHETPPGHHRHLPARRGGGERGGGVGTRTTCRSTDSVQGRSRPRRHFSRLLLSRRVSIASQNP